MNEAIAYQLSHSVYDFDLSNEELVAIIRALQNDENEHEDLVTALNDMRSMATGNHPSVANLERDVGRDSRVDEIG